MMDEKAKVWLNNNELAYNIWDKKYRHNGESFDEWLDRVSGFSPTVRQLIEEKKFLFGGRILASRNITDRKITYSNCYVIAPPEDSLESIFECGAKLARTYSYGGGCGVDISKLSPKDAIVHNAARRTSGSVSFMDFFSYITGLIGQEGRRGALMISIDCKHPDLEDFINIKKNPNLCTKANISVRISDEFMQAVIEDKDWEMSFYRPEACQTITKTKKARDLFYLLAKNNWEMAEPGVLYWDRIQNYNMLNNTNFRYAGVNPCAEEPLPAGGSCLLGSINLSEFVENPFTQSAYVKVDALEDATIKAVIALNDVLDAGCPLHPLQEQRNSVSKLRQIGLGTMGLADMLIKLGVVYGSPESLKLIGFIYKTMAKAAVEASLGLAKQFGCYADCDKEKLVESSFIKALELPENVLEDIKTYGLHNSQLLTCAPTGSIATMLGISTGVEPIFAMKYTRKTESLHGKEIFYDVYTPIADTYLKTHNTLPGYFIESKDIQPIDRIKVQGELQKYIDASISSTINLPEEATVEDVYGIYLEAWKHGLKGVTVYRANCARQGILTVEKPKEIQNTKAPKRPKELEADYYQVKSKGEQFIVLVGLLDGKPYEVFAFRPNMQVNIDSHKGVIVKKSKMHYAFESDHISIPDLQLANDSIEEKSATIYTSMLLRHGVDIKYIIKTAKKVNDNISSFSSAMCRVLSKYIQDTDVHGETCPECGGELVNESGCVHCKNCGWSKCG